jgi:hypothetical protein
MSLTTREARAAVASFRVREGLALSRFGPTKALAAAQQNFIQEPTPAADTVERIYSAGPAAAPFEFFPQLLKRGQHHAPTMKRQASVL